MSPLRTLTVGSKYQPPNFFSCYHDAQYLFNTELTERTNYNAFNLYKDLPIS